MIDHHCIAAIAISSRQRRFTQEKRQCRLRSLLSDEVLAAVLIPNRCAAKPPINIRSVTPIARRANRLLHSFLPQFADPKLERRYRDAHLQHRSIALKVTIAAGVLISILFAAIDQSTIHDPALPLFHVRLAGTLALLAFFVAASLGGRDRRIELLCFGAIITQIAVFTVMLALSSSAPPWYNQPTELWLALGVASFVVCGGSFVDGLLLALCTIFAFFVSVTVLRPEPPTLLWFHFAWLASTLGLAALGSFVLDRMLHLAWWQAQQLQIAEAGIRSLLNNVLPTSIAARKLAGESIISDNFSDASVLFADVVGFTSLSARLESRQVVGMLNELFSKFDRIIALQGLEKIKTIGDCYMAAGGIPRAAPGSSARRSPKRPSKCWRRLLRSQFRTARNLPSVLASTSGRFAPA